MSEMRTGIVVVGAGQAASQLVASLRQWGYQGPLTLVGEEPHLPYQRPPLSKKCLREGAVLSDLLLRPASFYESMECDMLVGVRAVAVDRESRRLSLADGRVLGYDHLVLATGAQARAWPGLEVGDAPVFTLRSFDDAVALEQQMGRIRRLAVLGGGYVGLEVAASAVKRGLQVAVFEAGSRVMQRSVGASTSALVERLHRQNGVALHCSVQVHAVHLDTDPAAKDAIRIDTSSGTHGADALVIGIGASPRTELARKAGLLCGQAIRVDGECRTSDPRIFAMGDCAEQVLHEGDEPTRLESVQNATDQAKCVAAVLAGKPLPPEPVPWFWSDQYGSRIQVAGRHRPDDQVVLRTWADKPDAQAAWYLRDGRVVAVEAVDAAEDFMAGRLWIKDRRCVDPALLADTTQALSSLNSSLA